MALGFQAWNVDGELQVDSKNPNLALIRSGSVTPIKDDSPSGGTNTYNATLPFGQAQDEVVAVYCANTFGLFWATTTEQVFRVFGSSPLYYWVFGRKTTPGSSGLQVFNTSGQLIFDATWQPMRIAGIIGSTTVLPAGRSYAVVFLSQAYVHNIRSQEGPPPGSIIFRESYLGMANIVSNTITVSTDLVWQVIQFYYPSPLSFNWTNGLQNRYMVVDVTGY